MTTRAQWASALLNLLRIGPTRLAIDKLVAWQTGEDTEAAYNPLATTWGHGSAGADDFNSAGVQNYATEQEGLLATLHTLQEPGAEGYGYDLIIGRLGTDCPIPRFIEAVVGSAWGTKTLPTVITDGMRDHPIGVPK